MRKLNFMNVFHSIHFRPVGQGLFVHGNIQTEDYSGTFEWVYDCGAQSLARLLPQIDAYAEHNTNRIHLLILSHFHLDHIAGIESLVAKRQPDTIVAPYLTITERLYFISRLTPGEADYANILLEPAAWLRRIAPKARIVFIAPADPNDDDGEFSVNDTPDRPPENKDQGFSGWPGLRGESIPSGDPDSTVSGVVVARTKAPFPAGRYWEFAFYNKPRPEMAQQVTSGAQALLEAFRQTGRTSQDHLDLIDGLRTVFNSVRGPFGETFRPNEISLVTYSGPRHFPTSVVDDQPWLVPVGLSPSATIIRGDFWPPRFPTAEASCGLLLTGDITLDPALLSEIESRFTPSRLEFVRYFQVPHHGSKRSFLLSPQATFRPPFAVFSSDRHHAGYDHPSSSVIELLPHSACVFVNEFQGAVVGGYFT